MTIVVNRNNTGAKNPDPMWLNATIKGLRKFSEIMSGKALRSRGRQAMIMY